MIIQVKKCLARECKAAGRGHRWEFDDFTARELKYVQKTLGVDIPVFLKHVQQGGMLEEALDCMLMLLVLLHRRDDIIVEFDDMDFSYSDLEFTSDEAAEPADEKPTGPATTSPRPEVPAGSSSTSGLAPEAASTPRSSSTPPDSGGTSG